MPCEEPEAKKPVRIVEFANHMLAYGNLEFPQDL